jgi:hypothetical protein
MLILKHKTFDKITLAPEQLVNVVRKIFEYDSISPFWLTDETYGIQRRWNFFKPSLS